MRWPRLSVITDSMLKVKYNFYYKIKFIILIDRQTRFSASNGWVSLVNQSNLTVTDANG